MAVNKMLISCPHCEARAQVRTSKQETKTMRSLNCQCTNVLCGHTFVAILEAVRTISPSAMPDAEVNLPSTQIALTLQQKGVLVSYEKPIKKKHSSAFDDCAADVGGTQFSDSRHAALQPQQAT